MRRAVVTGARGGIGSEVVDRLCRDGYRVAALDCKPSGRRRRENVIEITCDLASPADAESAFLRAGEALDHVDALVNIAGINHESPVAKMRSDDWDRVFDTNVGGMFLSVKHALPLMRESAGGAIINMSSISAHVASADYPAYVCSKAAVEAFTIALSQEVSDRGIRVNAIAPGWVNAGFTNAARAAAEHPGILENAARGAHLMGRMAEASEVASVVAWLAGSKSGFVTGQVIFVDGGLMRLH